MARMGLAGEPCGVPASLSAMVPSACSIEQRSILVMSERIIVGNLRRKALDAPQSIAITDSVASDEGLGSVG